MRTPFCCWLTDSDSISILVLLWPRQNMTSYLWVMTFLLTNIEKKSNLDSNWWSKIICDKKQLFSQQCPCVHQSFFLQNLFRQESCDEILSQFMASYKSVRNNYYCSESVELHSTSKLCVTWNLNKVFYHRTCKRFKCSFVFVYFS